jgi:hypothetical protein
MKILLFAMLILGSTAHAEVFTCPERYPAKSITLEDSTTGRKGIGRILKTGLTSAYMVSGELFSIQDMVPDIRKVPGGTNIGFSMFRDPKWLVCVYGERIEWWEKLDPKFTDCEVKIREVKRPLYPPSTWTATATCK